MTNSGVPAGAGGKRGERAPTSNFTMRLKPSLLEELKRSAAQHEHSITAEAERRLAQPETEEIGRLVSMAVSGVVERAGVSWRDDPHVKAQTRAAADMVLTLLLGAPVDPAELVQRLRAEIDLAASYATGKGMLSKALGIEPASKADIERGLDLADALIDARRAAEELVGNSEAER